MQQTVTLNAAGATVLQNSAYTPDGQLAEQITTTTSANGLDRTITYDWNGDGIVNQTETDDTVDNSGGSTTETVTDTNGSGVVLDSTTTTTSANGLVVTIDRDPTGAGYTAEQEVVTTISGGGSTDSVSDLTRNGSLIDQTVSTVSASGQPALLDELRALWVDWDRDMLPIPSDFALPPLDLSRMLW